jgi:hypothetical protein
MIINYSDGKSVQAVLLSRTEQTMRVAVQGADDAMELTNIHGIWVSDECEPVSIRFGWQRNQRKPEAGEDDFHCSHELAAGLIHSLFAGGAEETLELNLPHLMDSFMLASAC